MMKWLKSLLISVGLLSPYPLDPIFRSRPQGGSILRRWVLVELGASEHTILVDTLHQITVSEATPDVKGRQVMGLRFQALAMSLRTRRGRIQFDYRNPDDLTMLACLPLSVTAPALKVVASLSDIPWLDPEPDNVPEADVDGAESPAGPPEADNANPC